MIATVVYENEKLYTSSIVSKRNQIIIGRDNTMANHYITGLLTEIITPFRADGSIDYEKLAAQIDFQMECGVKNFFVNGFGGECHELHTDEKMKILETVYGRTKGKAKIMGCSFEPSLADNKALLDLYMKSGMCDCFCITAPPYFRHTQEALCEWAGELIDYCDKPCYIYNCVQMGTLFDPDTLERLWKEHKNFRGYKDATTEILHFLQTTLRIDKDNFDFLGGCDGLDGVMMMLGAVGCVSFMAVTCPVEMREMVDYGLAGDYEKCLAAQMKILKIRNALKKAPFNAAYMYAQKYTGGPVTERSRMVPDQDRVSDEAKEFIDETFRKLGMA